jgi:hypothetical protein
VDSFVVFSHTCVLFSIVIQIFCTEVCSNNNSVEGCMVPACNVLIVLYNFWKNIHHCCCCLELCTLPCYYCMSSSCSCLLLVAGSEIPLSEASTCTAPQLYFPKDIKYGHHFSTHYNQFIIASTFWQSRLFLIWSSKFQNLQTKFPFNELLILSLFMVILFYRALNKAKHTIFRKQVFSSLLSLLRKQWK